MRCSFEESCVKSGCVVRFLVLLNSADRAEDAECEDGSGAGGNL